MPISPKCYVLVWLREAFQIKKWGNLGWGSGGTEGSDVLLNLVMHFSSGWCRTMPGSAGLAYYEWYNGTNVFLAIFYPIFM